MVGHIKATIFLTFPDYASVLDVKTSAFYTSLYIGKNKYFLNTFLAGYNHLNKDLQRADHILAQNLKGRTSLSVVPTETIQPTGDRQNTRLSFSCRTNRHPVAFTKLFTRTDESSRNIRCPIRFYALTRQNGGRNTTSSGPYIKTFSNCYFVDMSVSFKRKTTPLQNPPQMGKRYAIWRRSRIGSALVRVRQPICSERSIMAIYLFHRSKL